MFDIMLCIVALLLLIFGTEKIFTYFFKNPCPDRRQLLIGGFLLSVSSLIISFTGVVDGLFLMWVGYTIVVGYSVIAYDRIMRN